ncbi:Uncharacterised protein [Vibrio cholerae]|nr:Uncharacterised protein [Vibrio cholerae]
MVLPPVYSGTLRFTPILKSLYSSPEVFFALSLLLLP